MVLPVLTMTRLPDPEPPADPEPGAELRPDVAGAFVPLLLRCQSISILAPLLVLFCLLFDLQQLEAKSPDPRSTFSDAVCLRAAVPAVNTLFFEGGDVRVAPSRLEAVQEASIFLAEEAPLLGLQSADMRGDRLVAGVG